MEHSRLAKASVENIIILFTTVIECQKCIEYTREMKDNEKLPFLQAIYLQCGITRT